MANANDMFDNLVNKKESFFVPPSSTKTFGPPNVRGEFYGHLQEANTKEVSWSRNGETYKAIVYNYSFVVAEENKSQSYTYLSYKDSSEQTSSGEDYIGRAYRANGVFRFIEPEEGDDFQSNSEGNKSYFRFCETLGVEIEKKVVKVDGQDVEVKVLPSLDSSQINGRPAIAVIDKGKPYTNKAGKEVTPYMVKFIKKWENGEMKDADVPF
jgi:hypothetical protein